MNTEILTSRLNNGLEALAKEHRGYVFAVTYANRTQAERKRAELGEGWRVWQGSRPFYVVRETNLSPTTP